MKQVWGFLLFAVVLVGSLWSGDKIILADENQQISECDHLGWFPEDFGLKDHSVFIYNGDYYIVSIYLPGEQFFAYARSQDLCNWEDLSPILEERTSEWDNLAIWAPQVFEENGVYYMFYTGVKGPYPIMTQSIMLATSTDPADPSSWMIVDQVFKPNHPGMIWEDNTWADCRDAHVFKQGSTYYMLYTGRDVDGVIVGLAAASSPSGPWQDWGSILTLDGSGMAESPTIWYANGGFYLFYNWASSSLPRGEMYHYGPTPAGPWSEGNFITPGWAYEIWSGIDGKTYASYLIDYDVTIKPLLWNTRFSPPQPFVGEQIVESFIPITTR